MPISPEKKKLYPKNWGDIRKSILKRAGNRCEFCGIENYSYRKRTDDGKFHKVSYLEIEYFDLKDGKITRIVLTIAHLDHDPTNNDPENLKALCQKCHLDHDRDEHIKNARERRRSQKAIGELFDA